MVKITHNINDVNHAKRNGVSFQFMIKCDKYAAHSAYAPDEAPKRRVLECDHQPASSIIPVVPPIQKIAKDGIGPCINSSMPPSNNITNILFNRWYTSTCISWQEKKSNHCVVLVEIGIIRDASYLNSDDAPNSIMVHSKHTNVV